MGFDMLGGGGPRRAPASALAPPRDRCLQQRNTRKPAVLSLQEAKTKGALRGTILMARSELDGAVVNFFRMVKASPPATSGKDWRRRVLDAASQRATSEEWSAFSTLIALISKGPHAKKGLAKAKLPQGLDGPEGQAALERAREKLKAIKPAADNLAAFGAVGRGLQTHRDNDEFLTSGDPNGWIGQRVRRFDLRTNRKYDGVIVSWTPHGESRTGERQPWWRVEDDIDPAHPFDELHSNLDEQEILAALKALQDDRGMPVPHVLSAEGPQEPCRSRGACSTSQHSPAVEQQSLLQIFWQRKGRPPPKGDGGGEKRQRTHTSTVDKASLLLTVDDFPVGSTVPLRRMRTDDETGGMSEYVEWCAVEGHCGKDRLRLHIPLASQADPSTTSLLEVQHLLEKLPPDSTSSDAPAEPAPLPPLRPGPALAMQPTPPPQGGPSSDAAASDSTPPPPLALRSAPPAEPAPPPLDSTNCVVCFDDIRSHILIPCGHRCVCETCLRQLQAQQDNLCPICRQTFTFATRVLNP